ncbi:MAG: hypothetical protein QGH40_03995, partial [bacterium]|nr:hypothetical protein [bacterium]
MQKNYVLVLAGLCMLVYCLMSTAVSAEAPAETPAEVPENNTGFFDPLLTNYKKALNAAFTDNTITADELFRMKNHISLIVTHAGITQNDIFTLLFETASIFAGGGAAGEKADRINKSLQILLRHTDRVITKTLENEKDSARVHLEAGLKTAIRTLKIMRTTTKNRRQANKTDQAAGQAGLEAARAATRESLEQALRAKKNEGATGDPMDKYGWLFGAAGQNETSVTGSNSQSGETQGS